MSRSSKWILDAKQDPKDPLYAVFFTARNKDNRDIEGFHQRKRSFLYHIPEEGGIPDVIERRFRQFEDEGLPGELSRMYISVNPRDPKKIKKNLMHMLIDDALPTETPIAHIETATVSIAMRKGMGITRKWLFDFDSDDKELLNRFTEELHKFTGSVAPEVYRTPHGYAVIVSHGFDIRQLDKKWQDLIEDGVISLKRDDLLCVAWGYGSNGDPNGISYDDSMNTGEFNRRGFKPGCTVKHFKGGLYRIDGTSLNTETNETMVIYTSLEPPYDTYARPVDMFCSEVDRDKYPDMEQKYRFELVDNKTAP